MSSKVDYLKKYLEPEKKKKKKKVKSKGEIQNKGFTDGRPCPRKNQNRYSPDIQSFLILKELAGHYLKGGPWIG